MNQKKRIVPVIHSFVVGNHYVGITSVEQYVGINKPTLPTLAPKEYMIEITYDDDFMCNNIAPIVSEIKSCFSAEVAAKFISSLLIHGLYQGLVKYDTIHDEQLFKPTFDFSNSPLLPNFVDVYRKLIEYFPHSVVDTFCNHIAFYGVKFVRDMDDRRILFGNEKLYANIEAVKWN